jgi:hypothetical protein
MPVAPVEKASIAALARMIDFMGYPFLSFTPFCLLAGEEPDR